VPGVTPQPAPTLTPPPTPTTPTTTSPPPVTPPPAVSGRLSLQTGSRLWFDGGSSVKDWSCKAPTLNVDVVTSKADAATAVVAGEKAVASVELTVPVMSLDCSNGTMDGHMRKALDANAHPSITFSLRSYDLAKSAENVTVTLSGTLTIHGKSLPVTFPATAVTAADGALRLTGVYELNMKDYGVKPPSLMLGTMNVREKVKVRFDLLLND
jgi:polyisoprenoid-binding protein YceI